MYRIFALHKFEDREQFVVGQILAIKKKLEQGTYDYSFLSDADLEVTKR